MDQLNQYLTQKYSPYYIPGSGSGDILMWGTTRDSQIIPGFLSLNVGVDYDPLSPNPNLTKGMITDTLNQSYSDFDGNSPLPPFSGSSGCFHTARTFPAFLSHIRRFLNTVMISGKRHRKHILWKMFVFMFGI